MILSRKVYDKLRVIFSTSVNETITNNQQNVFQQPHQRFLPLIETNTTTRSIAALFQGGIQNKNEFAREVKPNFVAAAPEPRERSINSFDVAQNQSNYNAVVPQPAGILQDHAKLNPIESAQAPPNVPGQPNMGS